MPDNRRFPSMCPDLSAWGPPRFQRPGHIALICVNEEGAVLSRRVKERFPSAQLWGSKEFFPGVGIYGNELKDFFRKIWPTHAGIVLFGAAGIAVRSAAPYITSKLSDPALVAVDDSGRYAISLLSGHEGSANALTEDIAQFLGAVPVITTGTETRRRLIAGVGCRKNVKGERIADALTQTIAAHGYSLSDLYAIAIADIKMNEPGIHEAARKLNVQLRIVPRERIRATQDVFQKNDDKNFVETITGVTAVCEPAAILSSLHSQLKIKKTVPLPGITIALAEDVFGL